MASLNKAQLIGYVGRDADLRYTSGGTACAKFSLATTEVWRTKDGEKKENTTWHNIVVWGKAAEALNQYLTKGKLIYVEGKIDNRSYDKDGQKRYISEVKADTVVLLGGTPGGGRRESAAPAGEQGRAFEGPDEPSPVTDDDIPF